MFHNLANLSGFFSLTPRFVRVKRAAGILPAEREAIAQERSNHSPIHLTTMPLPAGRWQHAKHILRFSGV
jgi:hypothetical protein